MMETFLATHGLTIHTYGGGKILKEVLTALAMLSGDNGILGPLMFFCAVIGMGLVCCKVLFHLDYEILFKHYLFPFLALYTALIIPTTTVRIEDELHKPHVYKVDGVPRLLAHLAEMVSSMGYYVTTALETAMHTVDDLKYTKTGLIFGSDTALDFRRYEITNPDLKKDLREFCHQCVLYDLALGRYSLNDLKTSTDLWGFLKQRTSKMGMMHYCSPELNPATGKKQCEYLSCQHAIAKLEPLFQQEKAYYAKQEMGKNLPLTFQAVTHLKEDSQKLISQQLMMNVLTEEFSAKEFAQQRAYAQQNSIYQIVGAGAAKGIVIMRAVFEALIYVSFILVLPLSLLPSGIKFLLNWVWMAVWIQFWPPFYVILNFIATVMTDTLNPVIASKGLNLLTSIGLQNFNQDTAALAGYLMLSVPYLSYMILQGGLQQFVQLSGTLTSPVQSGATAAAVEQTSGNYSYDNISIGQQAFENTTAFQNQVAPSLSAGYFAENKGYERTDYTTSGAIYTQQASNPTSSIQADLVIGESLQQQHQYAESFAETATQQYQTSVSQATQVGSGLMSHLAHAEAFNETYSSREAYDMQQTIRHLESSADNWGKQFNLSSKESMDIALAGAIGGELGVSKVLASFAGVGVNASGKASTGYNWGADESKLMSSAVNFAESAEFQEGYQKVRDHALSQASSSSQDEGVRLSQDFSQSLNEVQNSQEAYQVAKTELHQASETSSWYEQNAHLIKDNLNQKYVDWATEKYNTLYQDGSGLQRFKQVMQSSDPQDAYQRQSLLSEFVQAEIDGHTRISSPSRYQIPIEAYEKAQVAQVEPQPAKEKILEDYAGDAQGMHQLYGHLADHQSELKQHVQEAGERQDSYAYFTQNDMRYDKQAAINRLNGEKQRKMYDRAWEGIAGQETANDYRVKPAPFWKPAQGDR